MAKVKYSWTQPCCPKCWVGLVLKTGRAHNDTSAPFCCFCRVQIGRSEPKYMIRVNPGSVPYPTKKAEEE